MLVEATKTENGKFEVKDHKNEGYKISVSTPSQIATSTSYYLHSHTKRQVYFPSNPQTMWMTGEYFPLKIKIKIKKGRPYLS